MAGGHAVSHCWPHFHEACNSYPAQVLSGMDSADHLPLSQCQIIYPRQQLLTLRELEMIGFIENNVSKLSLFLREISRCEQVNLLLSPRICSSSWGVRVLLGAWEGPGDELQRHRGVGCIAFGSRDV